MSEIGQHRQDCLPIRFIFKRISFFRNGSEQPDVHAYSRLNHALMQSAHILRNQTRSFQLRNSTTAGKSTLLFSLLSFLIYILIDFSLLIFIS